MPAKWALGRIPANSQYPKCRQVCSDSGTSAMICDSEGRDVDMNCHRFRHMSLFFLIVILTTSRLLADSVDDYIREQMNARHLPGVVLVVLRDGKVIKQQSYGLANIELSVPTSNDSVFPLASVTKVFTATAVYLLVQEGKLRLSDKVTQCLGRNYRPELPQPHQRHPRHFPRITRRCPSRLDRCRRSRRRAQESRRSPIALQTRGEVELQPDGVLVTEVDCRKGFQIVARGVPE